MDVALIVDMNLKHSAYVFPHWLRLSEFAIRSVYISIFMQYCVRFSFLCNFFRREVYRISFHLDRKRKKNCNWRIFFLFVSIDDFETVTNHTICMFWLITQMTAVHSNFVMAFHSTSITWALFSTTVIAKTAADIATAGSRKPIGSEKIVQENYRLPHI